jgi:hypothetical protein
LKSLGQNGSLGLLAVGQNILATGAHVNLDCSERKK